MVHELGLEGVAIVTCGGRVFIGRFEGKAGELSQMMQPLVLMEMVQLDPRTQHPVATALDFRKPCAGTPIPKEIEMVPDTVQWLDSSNSKESILIQNYKNGISRYAASDAGLVAPTPADIGRSNIGKA